VPICAGCALALWHPQYIEQILRGDPFKPIEPCGSANAHEPEAPWV
jgi:hypothetical protein